MKHPVRLPELGNNWPDIARQLGDLRYDALADFLTAFSEKMEQDARADEGRSRPKLAAELFATAAELRLASEHVTRAWEICAPHMGADAGAGKAETPGP